MNGFVFLGGTCSDADWRSEFVPMLSVSYFNPVVKDWDEAAKRIEDEKKSASSLRVYVITPQMKGVFSIAEAVDDSNKHPDKMAFVVLSKYQGEEFSDGQMRSLDAVSQMIQANGGFTTITLSDLADFVNSRLGGQVI